MFTRRAYIVTIIALLAMRPAHAGDVLDRVKANGERVAAAYTATPPASFLDDNSQLAGFDIDVTRAKAFLSKILPH